MIVMMREVFDVAHIAEMKPQSQWVRISIRRRSDLWAITFLRISSADDFHQSTTAWRSKNDWNDNSFRWHCWRLAPKFRKKETCKNSKFKCLHWQCFESFLVEKFPALAWVQQQTRLTLSVCDNVCRTLSVGCSANLLLLTSVFFALTPSSFLLFVQCQRVPHSWCELSHSQLARTTVPMSRPIDFRENSSYSLSLWSIVHIRCPIVLLICCWLVVNLLFCGISGEKDGWSNRTFLDLSNLWLGSGHPFVVVGDQHLFVSFAQEVEQADSLSKDMWYVCAFVSLLFENLICCFLSRTKYQCSHWPARQACRCFDCQSNVGKVGWERREKCGAVIYAKHFAQAERIACGVQCESGEGTRGAGRIGRKVFSMGAE